MQTDTPTPRTDAATIQVPVAECPGLETITHPMVPRFVARQLERELAAVTKERDEAKQACSELDLKLGQAEADLAALRAELDEAKRAEDAVIACHKATLAERDQLRADNERLRADGARLDWLEANMPTLKHEIWPTHGWCEANLRAAIDAAMSAGFKPSNDGVKQP